MALPGTPAHGGELLALTRDAFRLLNHRERRQVVALMAALAFTGLFETIALATLMPVVAVILDPGLIGRYMTSTGVQAFLPGLNGDQFVIGAAIAAALLLVISSGLGLAVLWATNQFGVRIQTRLASDLMLAAMRAPYIWHLSQNSAMLVRFFHSDIVRWGRDFIQRLITMSQHLVSMIFPLILVLAFAPGAGLVSILIVAIVGFLLNRLVQSRIKRAADASKQATDRLVVVANNALAGVKDIKLACREVAFAQDFGNIFGYAGRASAANATWQVIPGSMLLLLGQLALLVLIAVLWTRGLSPGVIAGQMAFVVLVTSRVIPAANRFFGLFLSMRNVLPWVAEVIRVERDLSTLNAENHQLAAAPTAPEAWRMLALHNVTFSYPGKEEPALSAVSLELQRGRSYGFVGMSGAGKSTLVDIIIGLYRPSAGHVRLDGTSLNDIDMKSWQHQIGYVPQFPYMADDTLKANVALGTPRREVDEVRVRQCLDLANLTEFINGLPQGLDTPVGDRGIRMSGGQRQRVAIARAFYQSPQILVLDEATSSLDTVSEKEVQQAVAHLRGKVTLLVIAHRLATVRECDEVVYMEHGHVVARGTFEELLLSCPGFRLLANQLQ